MADVDYDERLGEWDGDEFNGWRFIRYDAEDEEDEEDEEPQVNQDHEEEVKVWVARSQPRDKKTGAIAFDISFKYHRGYLRSGFEYAEWKDHRVSILHLMDLEDNSFPYEAVTEAVNDWIHKAKQFPHARRNCLCCRNRATKGKVLCKGCNSKYGDLIYAE